MSEVKNNKKSKIEKKGGSRVLARWHRRLGLSSALVVVLISVTGIALNHIDSLYSNNDYIQSDLILDWYGIESANRVLAFDSSSSSSMPKIVWADGTVLFDLKPVLFNQGRLVSVINWDSIHHLFTTDAVHLLNSSGELIESIKFNMNESVSSVAKADHLSELILTFGSKQRVFNLKSLDLLDVPKRLAALAARQEGEAFKVYENIKALDVNEPEYRLSRKFMLLKSKVLQDLHSGRIFGGYGVLVMDLFALLFLLLAGTGCFMWIRRKKVA